MNILQLSTKIPYPPKDGGAFAVFSISKGLADAGHNVTIIAINPPKHHISSDNYKKLPPNITIIPVEINTNIRVIPALVNIFFSFLPYHVTRFKHIKFRQKLSEILNKSDFDIVQLETIYFGLYINTIRKISKAKIALRAHNAEYLLWGNIMKKEKNLCKKFFFFIENLKLKYFEIKILKKVDLIIPISNIDLQYFKKYSPAKFTVIPYGFDNNTFEINSKSLVRNEVFDIFYIGALDWIPNREGLIWFINNVWPLIVSEYRELKFHIAGRNSQDSFRKFISSVKNVQFHGEVYFAEKFMQDHAIMVIPLFSGSGIRIKIIQALGYGIPVIATKKAVEGINVEHNKHILIADTPEEFLLSTKRLLSDKQLVNNLIKNGKDFISLNYTNKPFINNLIHFYQN